MAIGLFLTAVDSWGIKIHFSPRLSPQKKSSFENCELFSKNRNKDVNGYVTAACTPKGQAYGYVMDHCRFTSNCPPKTVYIGRPWRETTQTVLINCELGAHIISEGWHDWDNPEAHAHSFYAEYGSTGPGGDLSRRVSWSHKLTEEDLPRFTKAAVLSGEDCWLPS